MCVHAREASGEAFARKRVDKNGRMVDKFGHFPNLAETTGHTHHVFCGRNREYL